MAHANTCLLAERANNKANAGWDGDAALGTRRSGRGASGAQEPARVARVAGYEFSPVIVVEPVLKARALGRHAVGRVNGDQRATVVDLASVHGPLTASNRTRASSQHDKQQVAHGGMVGPARQGVKVNG